MPDTFASFMEHCEPENILGKKVLSEKLAEKYRYSSLAKHYNSTANNLVASVMKDLERNRALPRSGSSKMPDTFASFGERGTMRNRWESPLRPIRQKPKYAQKAHEISKLISRETEELPRDELIARYQNILKGTEDVMVCYPYFIGNAIKCYEQKIYPEAITALWKAAVCLLFEYVLLMHPREFNDVAKDKARNNWKEAKTIDDFSSMKESVFLDCLEAISVISPTEKKQLRNCLTLRNICSHPNSAEITPSDTATYFETLLHVFNRFQYMDGPEFTVH